MLAYITPASGDDGVLSPFSPLCLALFMAVVDCEEMLQHLVSMGGVKLLWQNLTSSVVRSCYTDSDRMGGLISSVVNYLSPSLPSSTTLPSKSRRSDRSQYHTHHHQHNSNNNHVSAMAPVMQTANLKTATGCATGSDSGVPSTNTALVNFAPLAIVSSTHSRVRSPQSLLLPSQVLQRTKSPSWSHHFYDNDKFIVLNLKLPCPILLHEIILQPHTTAASYPSAVSVTAGLEGLCYAITGLIPTDTLSYIKLTLRSPVIASTINIRLFKPKENNALALSQIRLMGTTAFKGLTNTADLRQPHIGDDALRTQEDFGNCDWWLLLLKHCMKTLPGGRESVLEAGAGAPGACRACVNLLLAPQYAYSASNSIVSGTKLEAMLLQKPRSMHSNLCSEEVNLNNFSVSKGQSNKSLFFDVGNNSLSLSNIGGKKPDLMSAIEKVKSDAADLMAVVESLDFKSSAKRAKGVADLPNVSHQNENIKPKMFSSTAKLSEKKPSFPLVSNTISSTYQTTSSRSVTDQYSGTSPLEQIILGLCRQSPQWLEEFVAEMLCHPRLLQQSVNQRGSGLRLLYSVCVDEGRGHSLGVQVLLHWLLKLLRSADNSSSQLQVSASMLHTAAAIIWNTKQHLLQQDTDQLLKWIVIASCRGSGEMKTAFDQLLCALCYIQPRHFTTLTTLMAGVTEPDGKSVLLCSLSAGQLSSIVTAAHSAPAIRTLLASHLPVNIVYTVLEWCQRLVRTQIDRRNKSFGATGDAISSPTTTVIAPSSTLTYGELSPSTSSCHSITDMKYDAVAAASEVDDVAGLIWTLSGMCAQPAVQDWMGQGHGSLLWDTLFTVLGDPSLKSLNLDLSSLESATIELLRKACLNHSANHKNIASHLCDLIRRQKSIPSGGLCYVHSLSGFTRSLVVQVLLECERIVVEVEACSQVAFVCDPSLEWLPTPASPHPRHGLALNTRLLSIPLDTCVNEIVAELTDMSGLGSDSNKTCHVVSESVSTWRAAAPSSSNKDEPMVICYDDENDDEDENIVDEIIQMEDVELDAFNKLSMAAGITAKDKRNKDLANAEVLVATIVNGVIYSCSTSGEGKHIPSRI